MQDKKKEIILKCVDREKLIAVDINGGHQWKFLFGPFLYSELLQCVVKHNKDYETRIIIYVLKMSIKSTQMENRQTTYIFKENLVELLDKKP